ncbi:MAG: hypothetical protein V4736_15520 [Bdellovibrionota bacterium]
MKSLILLFTIFTSLNVWSQIHVGAVSTSTGGSGRGAVQSGDAGFINPATLVHLKGRSFYTAYQPGKTALSLSENTKDTIWASSLGYYRDQISDRTQIQDVRLAVAEFAQQKWSLGIAPHYYQLETSERRFAQPDVDVGMSFTPTPNMGIGIVGYNLMDDNKEIAQGYRPEATSAIGINYIYRSFLRARLDVQSQKGHKWSEPTFGGGIESYATRWIVVRVGYLSDRDLKQEMASGGIGFDMPRFRLNYGVVAQAQEFRDPRHVVDLSIPF